MSIFNLMRRCKRKKLMEKRREALSDILEDQLAYEAMVERARCAGDVINEGDVSRVLSRIDAVRQKVYAEESLEELDNLISDSEREGQLRAYLCPVSEIKNEGDLSISLMEEWNIPSTVTSNLRNSLGRDLENANSNIQAARGALRAIFEERDSWSRYTEYYEKEMVKFTRWLFAVAAVAIILSVFFLGVSRPIISIIFSGLVGSCISIVSKMPLMEIKFSGERVAYRRQILSRIGSGVIGSVVGCACLSWGLLSFSIQGQTFASILNTCSSFSAKRCTSAEFIILLGIPMLLGFSERALTTFEKRLFSEK